MSACRRFRALRLRFEATLWKAGGKPEKVVELMERATAALRVDGGRVTGIKNRAGWATPPAGRTPGTRTHPNRPAKCRLECIDDWPA